MPAQPKRYTRRAETSYTLGAFATLELLRYRPDRVVRVYVRYAVDLKDDSDDLAHIYARCSDHNIPVEVAPDVLNRLSHKKNLDVLALFAKYPLSLDAGADHLLLVAPRDLGNVGTMMRTALAFGVRDIAFVGDAADAFNPHAVRASIGAVFALSFAYFETLDDYRAAFDRPLYPLTPDAPDRLGDVSFNDPCTLLFGSEARGLSPDQRTLGQPLRIDHDPATESLNVAVAVGVALRELCRQRVG
ncbi:MAG: TrmH family RNA methyltransferase [Trueperaceae bacterium]|nr:TrmH family RNA methyltransferase [Trueperaceae bacterium]